MSRVSCNAHMYKCHRVHVHHPSRAKCVVIFVSEIIVNFDRVAPRAHREIRDTVCQISRPILEHMQRNRHQCDAGVLAVTPVMTIRSSVEMPMSTIEMSVNGGSMCMIIIYIDIYRRIRRIRRW